MGCELQPPHFTVSSKNARVHLNCIFHFDVMAATSVFGDLPVLN